MQCPDSKPLATPIPKFLCLFIMVKSKSAAGPDGRAAAMTSLRKTKPGPKPKVRMNSKKGKKNLVEISDDDEDDTEASGAVVVE